MERTLEQAMEGRSQNLQLIKWIAAILVMVSHAYPLTQGDTMSEPLLNLSWGRVSFGGLAVAVFFFTAGLYIAQSMEKKKTAKAFFTARCKRIFPPLMFTVLLTILLGACLTTRSLKSYFTDAATWKYLLNGILIPVHDLPGVFENQPYLATVNGALWTLPLEFAGYVVCYILYKCRMLTKKGGIIPSVLLIAGIVAMVLLEEKLQGMVNIIRPVLLFGMGMMTWVYRSHIYLGGIRAWVLSILFFTLLLMPFANIAICVVFPIFMVEVMYLKVQVPEKIAKPGVLSYGIYLCGFPIQQTIVHFYQKLQIAGLGKINTFAEVRIEDLPHMSPILNMVIAIPAACIVGMGIYLVTEHKKVK